MNKDRSRFSRVWYNEPTKPKTGSKKFKEELLLSTGDRYHYFPNTERMEDEELDEDNEGESTHPASFTRQYISLSDLNSIIKKENLDEKDVFFTASFRDDYLMLEIVHVKELSEQEQLEEYQKNYASWEERKRLEKEAELERIKWQMESLKKQAKLLGKK